MGKSTVVVGFRVSHSERDRLEALAARMNISTSELLRELVKSAQVQAVPQLTATIRSSRQEEVEHA